MAQSPSCRPTSTAGSEPTMRRGLTREDGASERRRCIPSLTPFRSQGRNSSPPDLIRRREPTDLGAPFVPPPVHKILHDRQPASVAVLVPKPLEDPLRGVPLLRLT